MTRGLDRSHGSWVRLGSLARARSGDKGDRLNIGVIARDRDAYEWLGIHLTPEFVASAIGGLGDGRVVRHDWPGLLAFNFVADHALGGGASRSLRLDTQGKAVAAALLEVMIPEPASTNGEGGTTR